MNTQNEKAREVGDDVASTDGIDIVKKSREGGPTYNVLWRNSDGSEVFIECTDYASSERVLHSLFTDAVGFDVKKATT